MKRKLLFSVTKKDLTIQTFCSGGPGGQHQNKVETGVRVIHRASGAVGESRTERSQHRNKQKAFRRMAESQKFQTWVRRKASEMATQKTIEQVVEQQLSPEFIKIEVKDERGRWVDTQDDSITNSE